MSENVRESLRDKVKGIHSTPAPRDRADYYRLMESYTDDIIALIRDALLSEAAVDAAAWSLWCDHTIPGKDFEGTHYAVARDALEAALAVAGLTDTGMEQGYE